MFLCLTNSGSKIHQATRERSLNRPSEYLSFKQCQFCNFFICDRPLFQKFTNITSTNGSKYRAKGNTNKYTNMSNLTIHLTWATYAKVGLRVKRCNNRATTLIRLKLRVSISIRFFCGSLTSNRSRPCPLCGLVPLMRPLRCRLWFFFESSHANVFCRRVSFLFLFITRVARFSISLKNRLLNISRGINSSLNRTRAICICNRVLIKGFFSRFR